ncbi:MAG: hypothetical protein LBD23_08785 [Oscillospiraceae bacterium]|jgi:hypothetical protein|nr:hypothetical protein [Oscillospiraceae bacterium]
MKKTWMILLALIMCASIGFIGCDDDPNNCEVCEKDPCECPCDVCDEYPCICVCETCEENPCVCLPPEPIVIFENGKWNSALGDVELTTGTLTDGKLIGTRINYGTGQYEHTFDVVASFENPIDASKHRKVVFTNNTIYEWAPWNSGDLFFDDNSIFNYGQAPNDGEGGKNTSFVFSSFTANAENVGAVDFTKFSGFRYAGASVMVTDLVKITLEY